MAAAPINQQAKVLAISPTASNPKVTVDPDTKKVRDFVFRAAFIDPFQGAVMANFASRSLKAKTAAIYIDNSSDYAKGLRKYVLNMEPESKKEITYNAVIIFDKDLDITGLK